MSLFGHLGEYTSISKAGASVVDLSKRLEALTHTFYIKG